MSPLNNKPTGLLFNVTCFSNIPKLVSSAEKGSPCRTVEVFVSQRLLKGLPDAGCHCRASPSISSLQQLIPSYMLQIERLLSLWLQNPSAFTEPILCLNPT